MLGMAPLNTVLSASGLSAKLVSTASYTCVNFLRLALTSASDWAETKAGQATHSRIEPSSQRDDDI